MHRPPIGRSLFSTTKLTKDTKEGTKKGEADARFAPFSAIGV